MTCVSEETKAELIAASRAYERETKRAADTRKRLHEAIISHKRDGAKVSEIEDIAPYRRGRITAILDDAGLVEKKPKKDAPEQS